MRFLKVKFKKYYSGTEIRSGVPFHAQVEVVRPDDPRDDRLNTMDYLQQEKIPSDATEEQYSKSVKFDINGSSFFMPEKDHEVALVGEYDHQEKIFKFKNMLPMYLVDDFRYDVYDLMRTSFFSPFNEKQILKMKEQYGNRITALLKTRKSDQFEIDGYNPRKMYSRNTPGGSNKFAMEVVKLRKYIQEFEILKHMGVSREDAAELCRKYAFEKKSVISTLSHNPYALRENIPLKIIDRYVREIHKSPNHEARVIALIRHKLEKAVDSGATALPYSVIDDYLSKQGVTLPKEIITTMREGDVDYSDGLFFSKKLRNLEMETAKELVKFMRAKDVKDLSNVIPKEKYLNDGQIAGVSKCLKSNFSIITGGPGVGKTTVTKSLINILKEHSTRELRIVCAAPTGKAAERMAESTGLEAVTMHSLLDSQHKSGFIGSRVNEIYADIIVVDELSMCDIYIFNKFVKSLRPGTRVIALGDKDQIPSVDPGNVLKDLIESRVINVSYLTESVRVDGDSGIGKNARRINRGEKPELTVGNKPKDDWHVIEFNDEEVVNGKTTSVEGLISGKIEHLMNNIMEKYLKISPDNVQILAPKYDGEIGVNALNKKLTPIFNKNRTNKYAKSITVRKDKKQGSGGNGLEYETFYEGDRVIQTRNDKKLGLKNGSVGVIKKIDPNGDFAIIDFDMGKGAIEISRAKMRELEVSFAMTIHKSQGSEYEVVIIPLSEENEDTMNRALLYTGVTRGKKHVFVIGNTKSLEKVIDNEHQPIRTTAFAKLLRQQYHKEVKENNRSKPVLSHDF